MSQDTSQADLNLEQFESNCLNFLRLYLSMKTRSSLGERGAYLSKAKPKAEDELSSEDIARELLQHYPVEHPAGVVPPGLPEELLANAPDMNAQLLASQYDVDRAVKLVSENKLSRLQVISLHLHSYKNILELELSDIPHLRARFEHLFARVFTELLDSLFPKRGLDESVVSDNCVLMWGRCVTHSFIPQEHILHNEITKDNS